MAIDLNTQIGPDGKRYEIGSVPESVAGENNARHAAVFGAPELGDVVWWDPTSQRLEFVDVDTAINYS